MSSAVVKHRNGRPRVTLPLTSSRKRIGAQRRDALAPSVAEPLSGATLVECLKWRERAPDTMAFWVESLEEPCVAATAGQLLQRAARAAQGMAELGLGLRERAMIVLPTGADFVYTFWGALVSGATPVPAYPPVGLHQLDAFRERLARMAALVDARLIVVPEILRSVLAAGGEPAANGRTMVTPEEIWAAAGGRERVVAPPTEDDLALIQFSSGSTGDPRAVCLTHRNILSNIRAFAARLHLQAGDLSVSWLPLYHDMGLIGTMMGTLLSNTQLVLIPPTDFLRRPTFWLQIMGKYRATASVAPQFAYNLCVRKADPDELANVDLSPLRVLLNGAEPVDAAGVAAFQRQFRSLGLRPGVVTPCYGLSEGTLAATMRSPGQRVRTMPIPTSARNGNRPSTKVACVGAPMNDTEVRIRSPRGAWQEEGKVGEVCLRGPSVSSGHLGIGGMTAALDAAGWLATGDLGFLDRGELFVTGRLKDLIIIGGRNLYPHDIEAAAAEVPGLRPGRVAALGVTEPERATEVLVLLAEFTAGPATAAAAAASLRQQVRTRFGVLPHDIVLLPRGQVPLTTSGKLRRAQARADYERGGFLDAVYRARPHLGVREQRQK